MAQSTSSQHRAQLIREMSKDMNRTRHSSGSSGQSQGAASPEPTVSDFDPENEAIMSTRQLDNNSHQLPELRASAQKYSRFARPESRPEPDFAINTSAIGRAFPDFSQGSTSSDDGSLSIEIGRGGKRATSGTIGKLGRSREYSSNAQLSLDGDSMDFSAPMIGNYEVIGTPPLRQHQASKKTDEIARDSLRRDAQLRQASALQKGGLEPSPPPAKTKDYGSEESRKGSGESRRTLASMHARVRDANDLSRISDERPPTVDLTARNTRFGSTKTQQTAFNDALPTRFSSTQGLSNGLASSKKQKSQKISTPNQGTQQSFMLPDLPNISELVSGVYEDGTPVFSRHSKPRASRFASGTTQVNSTGPSYAGVDEIPVPADEQAIFLSLKLLQDKVATLEKNNAEAENTIEDLEHKNRALEDEKSQRKISHRSDSALGTTDSDGGYETGSGQRKLLIEKNRLESSVRTLQSQIDSSNRKVSTAETILKNITQERDSAVSQLGVAYFTIEQLKTENEGLREENDELKVRVSQLANDRENENQKWASKEEALRRKLDRRTEAVRSMMEEAAAKHSSPQDKSIQATRSEDRTEAQRQDVAQPDVSVQKDASTIFDLHTQQNISTNMSSVRQQKNQIEDSQDSEDSSHDALKGKGKAKRQVKKSNRAENASVNEPSRDLTYLSFVDSDEIANLRKTLEQERIERKQRKDLSRLKKERDAITQTAPLEAQSQQPDQTFPRKSSMRDLTTRSLNQKEVIEPPLRSKTQTEHTRRHSETSMLSTRSRRRDLDADDMTSAFIVPDITIRNPGFSVQEVPQLTKEAQGVLDGLAKHDGHNCTVCKRAISHGECHDHGEAAIEKITISKPVPVSERMPKATQYEDEPTIRPAQAPGLALATVINGLEDEVVHLKIQIAQYQALYNGHDPSLSKRRRKSVQQKIESLLQAIDVKCDQIYGLYDVLEGQKQDGHEISEEEVEITLQSIGVDVAGLHLRGGGEEEEEEEGKPDERHPWDAESDADGSEDLPWEGIESTVETMKSGLAGATRRKSEI